MSNSFITSKQHQQHETKALNSTHIWTCQSSDKEDIPLFEMWQPEDKTYHTSNIPDDMTKYRTTRVIGSHHSVYIWRAQQTSSKERHPAKVSSDLNDFTTNEQLQLNVLHF